MLRTTKYSDAVAQLRAKGHEIRDEDIPVSAQTPQPEPARPLQLHGLDTGRRRAAPAARPRRDRTRWRQDRRGRESDAPAFIRNSRLDILATNRLGKALYWPLFQYPAGPVSLARYQFLNPGAEQYMTELDYQRAAAAALLRTETGQDPYDRDLNDLIGELSTLSKDFRTLWAAHHVRLHHAGLKRFRHPTVGDLTLDFEALPVPTDPGLTITAMSAEPGSPSADGLELLAPWAATLDENHQPAQRAANEQGATNRP